MKKTDILLKIAGNNSSYLIVGMFSFFHTFAGRNVRYTNPMNIFRTAFLCTLMPLFFFEGKAQLVVSNTAPYNSINYLVQNVLLGSGVTVSNITYTGAPNAIGYFNGLSSNINLDSGIVLTSGDLVTAVGPNNNGGATVANGTPGDLQLEQMTNNTINGSFDAAILEFDFVSNADTVKFEYVFGSEEYMEYVNTGFNDAFAFIISGVSVVLPPTNIALIPSPPAPPNTPVTIDNVNLGSYPLYYFDNETPPGLTVQYDGFTVVLTAIFPVQCGQTYHIKIVIADIGDDILDSGVFLRAGSFSSSGNIAVSSTVSYGNLNDSTLYEGCGQACIIIDRGQGNIANSDTVTLNFSGTAFNGIDITLLPDTIFFLPGQDSVTICINGLVDTLTEGSETLTMDAILLGGSACSSGDTASLTLYIDDHTPLSMAASGDTSICLGGSVSISANASGGVPPVVYNWSPAAGLSSTTIASPVATPTVTTTYYVSITDSCYAPLQTDSVTITVLPSGSVFVSATGNSIIEGCGQLCITVYRDTTNLSYQDTVALTFSGTATNGIDITLLPNSVIFSPGQDSVTICITATADAVTEGNETLNILGALLGGYLCTLSDTVALSLLIKDYIPLTLTAAGDSTICPGGMATILATASGGVAPVTYNWSPASGLSSTTVSNPTAAPTITTTYVVNISDSCNAPLQSANVTITVLPPGPVVANSSDVTVCLDGTPITLGTSVSGGAVPYTYQWITVSGNDLVSPSNAQNPSLVPTGSGSYLVTVSDFCGNINSDNVNVYVEDCITIIPNVISADGNGENDYFIIKNLDRFPNSRLVIFDRWGIKLYDDPDYKNNWNAHGYVDGTYYFILYRSDDEAFPGYVTVIRK